MSIKQFCILLITLFISNFAFSANPDSTEVYYNKNRVSFKKQILPVSFIATGALLNIGTIKNNIQDRIPVSNTSLDDIFQYTPMGQMYLYDILGFKHENSVFDQTKYLFISQFASSVIVHSLKNITKVQRPGNGKFTAFPSGHTCNAFVGATVLFHEFKETEPLLAYSGFVFATATGVLRMTNNVHWLPDVLAGAGIGILTVNLVYHFKPLQNFQPFKKNKNLAFTPLISTNSVGLQCRF